MNGKMMWQKMNSPIVITVIAISALFIFRASTKPNIAREIRGVYNELIAIVEDGASDAEKTRALQQFTQEIATQIRQGFQAGFASDSDGKNKDKVYLQTKAKIEIHGVKSVQSNWPGREQFIFTIRNISDQHIGTIKLNYEFYKGGELINVENKWISEIKILGPGEEFAMSAERSYPQGVQKEAYDLYKSDEVQIKVTSFDIKNVE